MAIYDIDVSTITPKSGSIIKSDQTSFSGSFTINGNSVYGIGMRLYHKQISSSGSTYTASWQWLVNSSFQYDTPYADGDVRTVTITGLSLSSYIGQSFAFQFFQYGHFLPFVYENDSASPYSFYRIVENGDDLSLKTGDYVHVFRTNTPQLGSGYFAFYVHVYGGGVIGSKMYIRTYKTKEDAFAGTLTGIGVGSNFFSGNSFYVRRVNYSPRIPLTLASSVPEIDLATTYADQTLTFYAGDNYYLCKNSQINLHFTLSGINSVITKYRVLLYSAQYGPVSGFEPTYTGEWIYNQDMYYQVSGQLNNSNLYIAVEAYDNLGVHYTTTRQQHSSDQYQYALAISFDYTQYVPTPSIGCTATYDCINGRDIITLDGLNALYGQVNTLATYGSSNYAQVSNFGTTGNTAISISDTDSLLYYPKTTSDAVPLYYFAPTGANGFPMFLWQTPNGTFSNTSGNLFEFSTGSIANNDYYYLRVYMKNNHIYRQTNAGANTVGIETVDDGEFYPDPNVIYLVAITDTRVVFRPFIYMLHNKLNFGFIAGQNVL